MKNLLSFLLIAFYACNSLQQKAEPNLQVSNKCMWIGDGRQLPTHDSLFYLERPAPLFRKEFSVGESIKSATLCITAAGYYKVSVNGKFIDENVLDPAWTDFSKRIYYSEYEVGSLLQRGDNCLGLTLGNGFYNPLPLRKWGRRNLREDTKVGNPVFIAKLRIEYTNGKTEDISTDKSWKYAYGPLLKNSVYLGVMYDAGKDIKGWDTAGFNDKNWHYAQKGQAPGGTLQKAFMAPVRVTEELSPVHIYACSNGKYIVDMGVNITGSYRIKLKGHKGDTVRFRFGERVYDNGELNPMTTVIGQIKRKGVGGPGAPNVAWQTDTYIFGDKKEDFFKPEFTYHTYRYMEIDGLSYTPQPNDIKGLFMHSNIRRANHFSCSSELINKIQEITDRTFRANLVSVQSDCPAREKFGYGGDLNATNESFIYNYHMQNFYRKTIYDWLDAMNDSCFVDTAPFVGVKYCGISWESAYLITQYYLWLYYNDTELVKDLYHENIKWMDKVARIHPEGMVHEGLSDHESMLPVPVQLTGTSHYLQCAQIMQCFASLVGDREHEKKYAQLAEKLKQILRVEFWEKPVRGEINRQTLFATLLYHNIVPENDIVAATDSLQKALSSGPNGHFSTGIFGTKYILETLSKYASIDEVYNVINSTGYPGWGHMIESGATTVWETWKESENTYSNCHPMFGTPSEWFYRYLGGIRPIPEAPGFKEFVLAPSVPKDLNFVNCTYHSPFGEIVSNWKKVGENTIEYSMKIPEGSTARLDLYVNMQESAQVLRNGKEMELRPDEWVNGMIILKAGEYMVRVNS